MADLALDPHPPGIGAPPPRTGPAADPPTVAAGGAPALVTLLTLPVVDGALGPTGLGVWVLLCGTVAALGPLTDATGHALARRRAAAGRHARGERRLPPLPVATAAAVAALTVLCGPWLAVTTGHPEWAAPVREAGMWLALAALATGWEHRWRTALDRAGRHRAVAAVVAGTAALEGIAVVVAVHAGGLPALAAATAGAAVLRLALTVTLARQHDLDPERSRTRPARTSDVLLLGGWYGPAAAGELTAGGRLLDAARAPAHLVALALRRSAATGFVRYGPGWLERFHLRNARAAAAVLAPAVAVLVAGADPLVRLWLGRPAPLAADTLALLAPGYALCVAAALTTLADRASPRTWRHSAGTLAAGATGVWLGGPTGAALAAALVTVGTAGQLLHRAHRDTGRPAGPVLRAVWRPVLAATLGGATAWCAGGHLPDAAGRAGAALALGCRTGLVLLVFLAALATLSRTVPVTAPRPSTEESG